MRKLEAASYRSSPWKDGGGTTTEVMRSPEGSSLDDFDWRISMAPVIEAGPFSRFRGVDRSLALLSGGALTLSVAGDPPLTLDGSSPPFCFPGDVEVLATLPAGPVVDFNVMTRRETCRHMLARLHASAPTRVTVSGDVLVLVVVRGESEIGQGAVRVHLRPRDALIVLAGEEAVELSPSPEVDLLATDLWRAAPISPGRRRGSEQTA